MAIGKGSASLVLMIVVVLLMVEGVSFSTAITPAWNYKIENMTNFAMSRNGQYLIVLCEGGPLCEEGQFYVFDRYGKLVDSECIENEITAVSIANNRTIFFGTRDGYYFLPTEGDKKEGKNLGICLTKTSICENGEVVIAGAGKEIIIFERGNIKDRKKTALPVEYTAISASGDTAVAVTENEILLYQISTDNWEKKSIKYQIKALAISDDGSTIACGISTDIIWILNSQLELENWVGAKGYATCIALTSDGRYLAWGTEGGNIVFYEYKESSEDGEKIGEEIWTYSTRNPTLDILTSADGNLIAVLSENITLFDSSGKILQELQPSGTVQSMYLSKSGEILSYNSNEELILLELCEHGRMYTCEYMFPSNKSSRSKHWLTKVGERDGSDPRKVLAADIDKDGKNEIIYSRANKIEVLKAEMLNQKWQWQVLWCKEFSLSPEVTVMDLTGDLVPEVVVTSTDNHMRFQVFDANGKEIKSHEFYSRWYSEPPKLSKQIRIFPHWSGNIDDDDSIEVVCHVSVDGELSISDEGQSFEPQGIYVFEYPSFKEEWYYPTAPQVQTVNLADINGDGQIEILAGSKASWKGRKEGNTDDYHVYVYAISLQKKELWPPKDMGNVIGEVDISVVDLNGDGKQDIVGGGGSYLTRKGILFALDSEGNPLREENIEFDYSVFLKGVADLDNDGDLEILMSSESYRQNIIIYDHNLREITQKKVSITLGKSALVTINDIDSDGKKEIILASDENKFLILNSNLEEEWEKNIPSLKNQGRRLNVVTVVNLNKCMNHLFVLGYKLFVYTYQIDPDHPNSKWPCTPWIITEQKINKAENLMDDGNKCFSRGDCQCWKEKYEEAKKIFEEIGDDAGIEEAEENILRGCVPRIERIINKIKENIVIMIILLIATIFGALLTIYKFIFKIGPYIRKKIEKSPQPREKSKKKRRWSKIRGNRTQENEKM